MIIRTITCHHVFNHGSMLQAYALVYYLESLGHDVKVIDYRPSNFPPLEINVRGVPKKYDVYGLRWLYRKLRLKRNLLERERRYKLEEFFNKYIPVTDEQYQSITELQSAPPMADLYIAGSDQIWNTSFQNGKDPAFYLDFGAPKRKISYAASFATDSIVQGCEVFVKRQIANLDAISVREQSGLKILRNLGYDGVQTVDPAFLLDRASWDRLDKSGSELNERYIIVYDFEYRESAIRSIAKRLARLSGCKIYTVSPFNKDYANRSFLVSGPDMFVSLIKHSQYVISNSFHGTVFSMIYGKDFFVVNRKDGLNVRMFDLLERYNLLDRLIDNRVTNDQLLAKIDYNIVHEKLNKDITYSKEFLAEQISLSQ